jgi:hypothetical protein
VLGTIDVRPALVASPLELPFLPRLAYVPCPLEALPVEARPLEHRRRALEASYARFEADMRSRGLSPAHRGPTVDDMLREAAVVRGRLADVLAAEARALSADGWVLLGEVRRLDAESDPLGRSLPEHVARERLAEARTVFEWAARSPGAERSAAAAFARVRLTEMAANVGDRPAAEAHYEAAANAFPSEAQRHALGEQAWAASAPRAAAEARAAAGTLADAERARSRAEAIAHLPRRPQSKSTPRAADAPSRRAELG